MKGKERKRKEKIYRGMKFPIHIEHRLPENKSPLVDLCTHPYQYPACAMDSGANSLHNAAKVQDHQEIPNLTHVLSNLANGEMSWDTPKLEMGESPAAAPGIDTDEQDCGLQPSEAEIRERKAQEGITARKEQRGWRRVIRNFSPS